MSLRLCFLLVLPVLLIVVERAPGELLLVSNSLPSAVIVRSDQGGELARYAAAELIKHIEELSGALLPEIAATGIRTRKPTETLIILDVLAGPLASSFLEKNPFPSANLASEGFILKSGAWSNHPALLIAGSDSAGTLYGAYEVLERLGVTFRLTGTIVPARRPNLTIGPLELRKEPALRRRGFLHTVCFDNASAFSWADYESMLDQMARMKCNYLQFWWFAFAPWVQFSFEGEPALFGDVSSKESGYHNWTFGGFGSRTIAEVTVGREHFADRPNLAPLEMQQVQTPEEAVAISTNLLNRIIRHAAQRNIKVWLAVEMAAVPPNLGRHGQIVGEAPFNYLFGTFLHPLDPVNRRIQFERLKAIARTYPGAEGIFLNFAELYPELRSPEHRAFFEAKRPQFYELRNLSLPWLTTLASIYGVSISPLIDSNIGYFDLFEHLLNRARAELPDTRFGLMTVGRGYVLPFFHKLLPESIPFASLESQGVWTMTGTPMHYFGNMGARERIIQPRVDDDFDMLGMQFNVRQYAEKERIFTEGVKHGLTGFAGQVERARGTEFNSSFLAEAAWNPQLTPDEFYRTQAQRLFGPNAAEGMYRAFTRLEKNQEYLGYYTFDGGYGVLQCCGPLREVHAARRYWRQKNPFGGPTAPAWTNLIFNTSDYLSRRQGSVQLLTEALELMEAERANVASHGRQEWRYLVNRTRSFRDVFVGLNQVRRGFVMFDDAFRGRGKGAAGQEQFVAQLEASLATVREGIAILQSATRTYSEIIDHVSDLAVLYHLNARVLLGMELSAKALENVVNYHRGKPYLEPVPFERLFPIRPDRGSED